MSVELRRWDCHAHAFGPAGRFPAVADRGYDPPGVRPAAHLAEAEAAGIGGVVWVQPSIYGGDNAALLAALRTSRVAVRGVIAPPANADLPALRRLHARGVRGLRLNLASRGGNGLDTLKPHAGALAELGWHVAAFLDATEEGLLDAVVGAAGAPVVLDHFGWAGGRRLPGLAAFAPLLRQLEAGRVWVKLSAAYQICGGATDCPEATELAARLLTANPERILFASNWPHVGQSLTIGLPSLVATTRAWAASLGVEPEGILGTNAERLYR